MLLQKPSPAGIRRSESVVADTGRRPTLLTLRTLAPLRPDSDPIMVSDEQSISPTSSTRSGRSFYHDATSGPLIEDNEEPIRPFNTLQGLCREAGEQYPPPRSPSTWEIRREYVAYDNEYNLTTTRIHDMGYGEPPSSIHEGSTQMIYLDEEKPLMRLKRRASSVGDAMVVLVKGVRRTMGSLKRRGSKAMGIQNIQEVSRIENGERSGFMAGEDTENEANGPDFGPVVWRRLQHEL
jgi:hypothetical protein